VAPRAGLLAPPPRGDRVQGGEDGLIYFAKIYPPTHGAFSPCAGVDQGAGRVVAWRRKSASTKDLDGPGRWGTGGEVVPQRGGVVTHSNAKFTVAKNVGG
jgi:hypothetical protein